MASAISVRSEDHVDRHERVVAYYQEALSRKAEVPDYAYPPVYIGPTWKIDANGYWLLPERTLGWDVLGWCGTWLQHSKDVPWRFTLEQARFFLWWYSLDETGRFLYSDAVLQRLKGWGKDPVGACYLATELLGPCRFVEFYHGNDAVAADNPNAWVQTAAVSLEQTKNTMRLFPGLFTEEAKAKFQLQIGKEQIYALGSTRFLQAHTSSPTTMEGNRVTAVVANETHHWFEANDGKEMAKVIRRNAAKAPDGSARSLRITNAYEPGLGSVAEDDRELYEKVASGEATDIGLLYDSIEAAPEAPLTAEAAPLVVPSIRGDAYWLNPQSIVGEILDLRNPPSTSRRFWYNQIVATEEAWVTMQQWDACADPSIELIEGDQIVEFFDGSKSNDATALMACRVSDGALFFRGVWQRPPNAPGWTVPRDQVDDLVRRDFERYDVVAFFGDPGAGEDDTGERFWDAYLDGWSRDFGGDGPDPSRLCLWAVEGGRGRHGTLWDMRSPDRLKQFTESCGRTFTDINERSLRHDANRRVRLHVLNARSRENSYGISIGKESRMSAKKIDLAVCAIGARMLLRMYLALPEEKRRKKRKKVGVTWV